MARATPRSLSRAIVGSGSIVRTRGTIAQASRRQPSIRRRMLGSTAPQSSLQTLDRNEAELASPRIRRSPRRQARAAAGDRLSQWAPAQASRRCSSIHLRVVNQARRIARLPVRPPRRCQVRPVRGHQRPRRVRSWQHHLGRPAGNCCRGGRNSRTFRHHPCADSRRLRTTGDRVATRPASIAKIGTRKRRRPTRLRRQDRTTARRDASRTSTFGC